MAFLVHGVAFEAAEYLTRGASIAGSDSPLAIVSGWFKATDQQAASFIIFAVGPGDASFSITLDAGVLFFDAITASEAQRFLVGYNILGLADGLWHHFAIGIDTNQSAGNKLATCSIDGVAAGELTRNDLSAAFTVPWASFTDFAVAARSDGTDEIKGDLAEIYVNVGSYLDLTTAPNIAKFYAAGKPVDLGADGSTPTGLAPEVYLSVREGGAANDIATNRGTAGNFTITGTLSLSATSPSDDFLTVMGATAGHTIAAGSLAQVNALMAVAATAGHTVAAGALAQINSLIAAAGLQGHTAFPPALIRILFAVAAEHGHAVAAGALAQVNTLAVGAATQGHDAAPSVVIVNLIPVEIIAGHIVASPGLAQLAVLQTVPALQGASVDSPGLAQAAILQTVPGTQGASVASPALLQANTLAAVPGTQGHTAQAPGLINILVSVSPLAGHTVAAGKLVQVGILRTVSALTGHVVTPDRLVQFYTQGVANSLTGHVVNPGMLHVLIPGSSLPENTYVVLPDGRSYQILGRGEDIVIQGEPRNIDVTPYGDLVQ